MDSVDTIIIGAGVVGLAVARAAALEGRDILILEAETAIGTITSARNSGVIHAGIYYHPGGLKAQLCVQGRHKLYDYAAQHGIPHKRCGKLLVVTDDSQILKLEEWKSIAEQNGVTGLKMLTPENVRKMEPEVFCVAAMHSPDTGIIDVHSYLLALLGDAEAAGALLALQAPLTKAWVTENGFVVQVGGETPMEIACRTLINSAGLSAQEVARQIDGLDPATIPPQVLAKGNYFSMTGKPPFKMLIYPLPVLGSSGLHATCDLAGRIRFGPDVEWIDKIDYTVDPNRALQFEESIRHYWPTMPHGILQPDYCGVRPKVARASPHDTDFIIQSEETHKIPNLINLYGIESPGLTSSLALADEVMTRLRVPTN